MTDAGRIAALERRIDEVESREVNEAYQAAKAEAADP